MRYVVGWVVLLAPALTVQAQFTSPDVRLAWSGLLQFDVRWLAQGSPTDAQFLLRRARVEVEATLLERYRFVLEPDFGEGEVELKDSWMEAHVGGGLAVRAGRFKTPFGLEVLRSSRLLWFAERGLPSALAPGRDLGVMLHGRWMDERMEAALGVFGGVPDGASEREDPSADKDVALRVFAYPFRGALAGTGVGVAATVGAETGSEESPALAAYETPAGAVLFKHEGVWADGLRRRLAPQATIFAGPVGLLAEYTISQYYLQTASGSELRSHWAWQLAAAWALTGQTQRPDGLQLRPGTDAPSKGSLELAARLHGLTLDSRVPIPDHDVFAWSIAFHWHPAPHMRLSMMAERVMGAALPEAELLFVVRAQQQF